MPFLQQARQVPLWVLQQNLEHQLYLIAELALHLPAQAGRLVRGPS